MVIANILHINQSLRKESECQAIKSIMIPFSPLLNSVNFVNFWQILLEMFGVLSLQMYFFSINEYFCLQLWWNEAKPVKSKRGLVLIESLCGIANCEGSSLYVLVNNHHSGRDPWGGDWGIGAGVGGHRPWNLAGGPFRVQWFPARVQLIAP